MVSKKNRKEKKLLIVGNGGIALEGINIALTGKDMGPFLTSMNENGFEVIYTGFRGSSKNNRFIYTFNLNENGIKYFVIKGGRRNPLRYIGLLKLAYYIVISEFVYLFYPGGFSKITARICKLIGRKYGVFVRGYGLYIPDAKRKSESENVFSDSFILKNASYLITVSPRMRSELLAFNKNVSTITDIIWDLKDISIRENKNYQISSWRFLFVGSITELKGVTELLESARILNEKGLDFTLRLVGDGYLLNEFVNKQNAFKY
jgi:glycosyltransferase involved in cell wall biosynthesis